MIFNSSQILPFGLSFESYLKCYIWCESKIVVYYKRRVKHSTCLRYIFIIKDSFLLYCILSSALTFVYYRLPCISGTMAMVHISLAFLSCARSRRALPRPSTAPRLWAPRLLCVWVQALCAHQLGCPQFPGKGKRTKLNDIKPRALHCDMLAVLWWCTIFCLFVPTATWKQHQYFTAQPST